MSDRALERTDERQALRVQLAENLKVHHVQLVDLLSQAFDEHSYEDAIYRFYHHSYKVFHLQDLTTEIVVALQGLLPERELNAWFREIVDGGTGKSFDLSLNANWLKHTRPILEAFFHARYFLEMAVRYEDIEVDGILPSGWAGLLYLYDLR